MKTIRQIFAAAMLLVSLVVISGCSFGRTRELIERSPIESTSVSRGVARSETNNYQIYKGSDGRIIIIQMPVEGGR